MSSKPAAELIARTDRALQGLEDAAIARVYAALDASYVRLERDLIKAYEQHAGNLSLLPNQRKLLVLTQVKDLLRLVDPKSAKQIQKEFQNLLRGSTEQGRSLAAALTEAIGNEKAETFADVPIEALRFQAEQGVKRLERHGEEFASKASAIVEQGLVQGWGARKVATIMRGELGITKGRAERIARTESINALDSATRSSYQQNNIGYVQRIGTEDRRTCSFCAARVGNVYPVDKAPATLHPNDRCYNAPWKREWVEAGLVDMAWIEKHRAGVLAQLEAQGKQPNPGVAPFEKAAGATEPLKPYWKPGNKLPRWTKPKPKAEPKAKTSAKASTKATKPATEFPQTIDGLEVVRSLGGSTGATLVRDPASGQQFVLKRGSSPDHLREEAIADEAYRALGVPVPKSKIYETSSEPAKLAEFIEGRSLAEVMATPSAESRRVQKELQKHFAADALLGNWDVVGMSLDNVLVADDGTVYRIDNGGSLRYRAQGGLKGDRWNGYPTELWSLRDKGVNAQTAQSFGNLSFAALAGQIEELATRENSLLKALPKELQPTMQKRLAEMKRVAEINNTLVADQWKESYIDKFTRHSMGLRATPGVVDRLPQELKQKGGKGVRVFDEKKREFDHLRGDKSIMYDVQKYIERSGGNYKLLQRWMSAQAGSSWSDDSQALKWFLAEQRNASNENYYWHHGADTAKDHHKRIAGQFGADKFAESFAAWHAFNYELVSNVQFAQNNAETRSIRLMRTEAKAVMEMNGFQRGDLNVKMRRGAAESTSIYEAVKVYGSEMTLQDVPWHRVLGCYFYERVLGSGGTAFMGDEENEFVCLLDDIPFDYTTPSSQPASKTKSKAKSKPKSADPDDDFDLESLLPD